MTFLELIAIGLVVVFIATYFGPTIWAAIYGQKQATSIPGVPDSIATADAKLRREFDTWADLRARCEQAEYQGLIPTLDKIHFDRLQTILGQNVSKSTVTSPAKEAQS